MTPPSVARWVQLERLWTRLQRLTAATRELDQAEHWTDGLTPKQLRERGETRVWIAKTSAALDAQIEREYAALSMRTAEAYIRRRERERLDAAKATDLLLT